MVSVLARALLIVCPLLLAACNCCATPPPTLAPGALTQDQAIAAALRQAPPGLTSASVEYATVGQNPFTPTSGSPVWLVRLNGGGDLPSCAPGYLDRVPSPSGSPCLDNQQGKAANGLTAVIDPFTGSLLGWSNQ